MRKAGTLEAEWRHVPRGSVSMGAKEDESSTGRVWAAVFHLVRPVFAYGRFQTYEPFISLILQFFQAAVNRRQ
jgi:hypothetical protein